MNVVQTTSGAEAPEYVKDSYRMSYAVDELDGPSWQTLAYAADIDIAQELYESAVNNGGIYRLVELDGSGEGFAFINGVLE